MVLQSNERFSVVVKQFNSVGVCFVTSIIDNGFFDEGRNELINLLDYAYRNPNTNKITIHKLLTYKEGDIF